MSIHSVLQLKSSWLAMVKAMVKEVTIHDQLVIEWYVDLSKTVDEHMTFNYFNIFSFPGIIFQ